MDVFWTDQHLELAAGLLDLFDIPVTFNAGTSVMQQPGLGSKLGEMTRQIEHALLRGQYDLGGSPGRYRHGNRRSDSRLPLSGASCAC
jgi:hypothetical protein